MKPEHLAVHYFKLRGFESRFDVCRGLKLHSLHARPSPARDRGEHMVMLHGISSSSMQFGRLLLEMRNAGFHVHAPDFPGHGLSDEAPEPLTPAGLITWLDTWMDKVAPREFILLGNSMGGSLALRFTHDHPERVSKLILLSPGVGFESQEAWEAFRKTLVARDLKEAQAFTRRVFADSHWFLPWISRFVMKSLNQRAVKEILEAVSAEDFALQARIAEMTKATLLVWGKKDKILPRSNLEFLKRVLPPSVKLLEPAHVGHSPQLDSPTWLRDAILGWLGSDAALSPRLNCLAPSSRDPAGS